MDRMMAMNSASYIVTVFLLFQFLLVVYGNKRYAEYDVVNECRVRSDLNYHLGSGHFSAVKLKIPRQVPFSDRINCKLTIDTSDDSLFATVDYADSNSTQASSSKCSNLVTTPSFKKSNMSLDVCHLKSERLQNAYTGKEIKFTFYFNHPTRTDTSDYTIYVTAYTHGCNSHKMNDLFRCDDNNHVCIWREFRCDGVRNCIDRSDENNCENWQFGNAEQSIGVQHRAMIIGTTISILIYFSSVYVST